MELTFHSVLTGLVWNLQLEQLKGVGELSLLRHQFQSRQTSALIYKEMERGDKGQPVQME